LAERFFLSNKATRRATTFHGQTGKLFAVVLKGISVTKISATPAVDGLRSATPQPRGNPRQAVLDRIDEFEKRLDLMAHCLDSNSDAGTPNPLPSIARARLPLSDIFLTVSVTAYVCITTVLSIAYLVR
jgi:hypothetical protein